ncbi:MAG: YhdP family protein [Limnohabitans sp.]
MPTSSEPLSWLTRLSRALAWLALASGLCIGAGWAALHVWIVPRIGDFRPALEQLATRTMGMPVQIGELRAESTGWVPSFELRDIRLLDTQGRPALSLPRVVLAISVRSVLNLGLEQLVLDQPELDVRHTASGQWLVAGLTLGSVGGEHSAAADWLFSQREVVVRGGTLHWTSEHLPPRPGQPAPNAQALSLTQVDLVLRNPLRQHELRIDATPPAEWGERFVLMGHFQRGLLSTHPGHFKDWNGQAYAYFPQVDVSQLRQHVRLGIDLLSGQGRLRLWSDISRGEWAGGTADLDLRGVQLRLAPDLDPLGFHQISGRVSGRYGERDWSITTQQLAFVSDQGLTWPGGNASVEYRPEQGGRPASGKLQGEQLDLQALREVALRMPLPEHWHAQLARHVAAGQVRSLRLQWESTSGAMSQYQGQIEADNIHIQTSPESDERGPGIQGAQISAQFNQQGGQLQLKVGQGGSLTWPDLLEDDTLNVQQLQSDVRWTLQENELRAAQWKTQLANEDLQGQMQGQWQHATTGPGLLDLQAQIAQAQASRIHRYLPLDLPQDIRHYLRDSVRKGVVSKLQVRIKGDLSNIPMAHPREGEFRFSGHLQGVEMAYVPPRLLPAGSLPWPVLQDLQGDLVFERQGMKLSGASARFGEGRQAVQIGLLRAGIADLTHDPKLDIQADLKGPAQQVLSTLTQSPVDRLLSGALAQATASGNLQGRLRLDIPLLRAQDTRLQGSVLLGGNDIQLHPHAPLLGRAQGTVQFSDSGFSLQGVQARLLGGTSRLEGGLRSGAVPAGEPRLLVRAQGQISADGLRAARNLHPLDDLAQQARGQTSYSATLGWRDDQPELSLRSSLEGLELNLPAPLGKRAVQALPLTVTSRVLPSTSGPRDQLQIDIGTNASAVYVRDLSGHTPRAIRGNLAIGTRTGGISSLPEQGVAALVRLDDLPLDTWEKLLPDTAASASDDTDDAWRSYLPNRIGLQAGTLTTGGRTLHDVVAGITRDGTTWRANLDARELSGHAQYVQPGRQQAGRLYARLARLNLPPSAVSDVESIMEAPPSSMPALDIQIEDLVLRGKALGRVEIEATNQDVRAPRSGAREWQLQKFNVIVPEASLRASGRWSAPADNRPRRTEMGFRLDVQDAGALLTRLGTPGALRAGAGHLEGQIGWNGSPLALHYPSLQGQFQIRMGRGQFLKADPGVAKLLGVLSLQGLPRRLLLDFRDVFFEGFAFDTVQGDVEIQQGIASTRNLQIEGVNAVVKMEGSADIAHETQQLKVLILPQLNAGGASVVAGLAINPVVGLTAYLAQWLLSSPLSKASIQEFAIDGSWNEPRVTRIDVSPPARGAAPGRQP